MLDVGELADVAMAPPEMWLPAMDVVDNGFFSSVSNFSWIFHFCR